MRGINKIILAGCLGNDPEMATSNGGKQYAKLSLATHNRFRDGEGNFTDFTEWHRVTVWGKKADICKNYLTKGSPVVIEGYVSSFKSKTDPMVMHTRIVAEELHLIAPRPKAQAELS